ncbi:hypothetical protein HPP92_015631 [Vanilla planifolia]|nr:hypothetical protein HPP92_015631 [Vanilla planifolia]
MSVPLQCSTAVGTNLPPPGPVSYAPSLPPLPPQPPMPAVEVESPPPSDTSSSLTPPGIASPPSISEGQRPFVLPSSAKEISTVQSLSMLAVSVLAVFCAF